MVIYPANYLVFFWYFVVRFYLLASRQFQVATAIVIFFGLFLSLALHEQRSYIDWTPRGLNPNRVGFKPQVVILSGTVYTKKQHQMKTGNAYFEIRMRGSDYYYCRKWNNFDWKPGSWFEFQLAIPGCAWHFGLSTGRFGAGGGGGSWFGYPKDLIPARRLWNGTNFVGAQPDNLVSEEQEWHLREEFQNLEKVGPYLIPKQIKFSYGFDDRDEIYTIKKIEFLTEPSTNWFWDVKRKYVDHGELTNDLREPGPLVGKR